MRLIAIFAGAALLALSPLPAVAERPASAPHAHGAATGEAWPVEDGQANRQGRRGGREWTQYPLIVPAMAPRGERAGNILALKNLEAGVLEVYSPDQARRQYPVAAEGVRVEPATPKSGNYYWVIARAARGNQVDVASTATYFSNPGAAPTALLQARKHELEIVPLLLPREHGSYRESEKWQFLLRFNGQPLANQAVTLETEFGSRIAFSSDADGVATVLFPYDFKEEEPGHAHGGHSGPRRAKFVLATEHQHGDTHYLSAFNYSYSPDAARGKNLWAGLGFGAFGMLLAVPLLRHGKNNGEKSS